FNFNTSKDKNIYLNRPLFLVENSFFDNHIEQYKWKKPTFKSRLEFTFNNRLFKYYINKDVSMIRYKYLNMIGIKKMIEGTAENLASVEETAYGALGRIALENNATMIVLGLGLAFDGINVPLSIFPDHALTINAWRVMVDELSNKTPIEYQNSYYFTRKSN